MKCKWGRAWKKYRNKEGMKTQKTILLQKSRAKERLKNYSTSVAKLSQVTEVE